MKSESPLSLAHSNNFNYFVRSYLQPQFRKVARKIMLSDTIKIFHEAQENLINVFAFHKYRIT